MDCSKGEWKYGEDREGKPAVAVYLGSWYRRIHPIVAKVFGRTKKEAKANAHLIAATPDMYCALKEMLVDWQSGDIEIAGNTRDLIDKALAKAEAETPA